MPATPHILRIAVPAPVHGCFDYLPPRDASGGFIPGQRLRVPFGRRTAVGVLLELAEDSPVEHHRLKPACELLDVQALLPPDLLRLLSWASRYYQHPIGEVIAGALPVLLRRGRKPKVAGQERWGLTPAGRAAGSGEPARAPRQAALLDILRARPDGLSAEAITALLPRWRDTMKRLQARGWVTQTETPCLIASYGTMPDAAHELNNDQRAATDTVVAALGGYGCFLLDGVTGSGKTEVYLEIIESVIREGRQALVLVPEISLTPQTVDRFRRRYQVPVAVLHSGLGEQERLCAWLCARDGSAPIVIGTRSAVFTPLARPGVIIVDEEHDLSFKQQDGFRYHARDLAVVRARNAAVPIVLGSATPSLESLHNTAQGRFQTLRLVERVGGARQPRIGILDIRRQKLSGGLSGPLLGIIARHLDQGGQVLLFLNRRGYAPTLMCHDCGWVAGCTRCDSRMTLHQGRQRLLCHHCGHQYPVETRCPECGADELHCLGQGTERIEEVLRNHFPGVECARIDRDTTRKRGSMHKLLRGVRDGHTRLLIGTQMLAKGHHFPDVCLVCILDVDQGLYSADFRAAERMAQLIIQVAGRAGRADRPGEVYVQTHHPDHPLLHTLLSQGYGNFARQVLEERHAARLPPCTNMALLRAEAVDADAADEFLQAARRLADDIGGGEVVITGPVPAPMARRAGRHRAQLLLQSQSRPPLQTFLGLWLGQIGKLKSARRVRWSLDVDPMEMF